MVTLAELTRQRDALLRELESLRKKAGKRGGQKRSSGSKFSDVLGGDYRLFVSPTHSMCDECGIALYQHLIRPYQRNLSWGDVQLCPKCRAKAVSGEKLKCYDFLFPNRD